MCFPFHQEKKNEKRKFHSTLRFKNGRDSNAKKKNKPGEVKTKPIALHTTTHSTCTSFARVTVAKLSKFLVPFFSRGLIENRLADGSKWSNGVAAVGGGSYLPKCLPFIYPDTLASSLYLVADESQRYDKHKIASPIVRCDECVLRAALLGLNQHTKCTRAHNTQKPNIQHASVPVYLTTSKSLCEEKKKYAEPFARRKCV